MSYEPVYGPGYPRWAAEHEQDPQRRDLARELLLAERKVEDLEKLAGDLILLTRIGFLVTVNGERADASAVKDPETHSLLMRVLTARDSAEAAARVVSETN